MLELRLKTVSQLAADDPCFAYGALYRANDLRRELSFVCALRSRVTPVDQFSQGAGLLFTRRAEVEGEDLVAVVGEGRVVFVLGGLRMLGSEDEEHQVAEASQVEVLSVGRLPTGGRVNLEAPRVSETEGFDSGRYVGTQRLQALDCRADKDKWPASQHTASLAERGGSSPAGSPRRRGSGDGRCARLGAAAASECDPPGARIELSLGERWVLTPSNGGEVPGAPGTSVPTQRLFGSGAFGRGRAGAPTEQAEIRTEEFTKSCVNSYVVRAIRAFLPGRVAAMSNPTAIYALLQAVIAAVSVLGGAMAVVSGFRASRARRVGSPADLLQRGINLGIAVGFDAGAPCAILAFLIVIMTA